jgi:hypothetical protein
MTPTIRIAYLSLAVVAGLGFGYVQGRHTTDREIAHLERRLQKLERNQVGLQEAFLSGSAAKRRRLAQDLGYRALPPSNMRGEEPSQGPGAEEAQARERYREIETTFAAEPLNPAWAAKARGTVENVLIEAASTSGVTPRTSRIDCRSSTCQISLDLADTGEIDALIQPLLIDIAELLPQATMVQVPSADGQRIELQVFARTKG